MKTTTVHICDLGGFTGKRGNVFQTERVNTEVLAPLLFRVRAISSAFHDAKEVDPFTGRPTGEALEAFRWILREPYSRTRMEPGSFAQFCDDLGPGYDRSRVRREGIPQGAYGWKETVGGIEGVRRSWVRRRGRFTGFQNIVKGC